VRVAEGRHVYGYYGISANGSTGLKDKTTGTAKKVGKYSMLTHELIEEWPSLVYAAKVLKRPFSSLSLDVVNRLPRDGFVYAYI
jgi:hypothetical protein